MYFKQSKTRQLKLAIDTTARRVYLLSRWARHSVPPGCRDVVVEGSNIFVDFVSGDEAEKKAARLQFL
jgi:hypothetical protein